jgi:hypothetical protein
VRTLPAGIKVAVDALGEREGGIDALAVVLGEPCR